MNKTKPKVTGAVLGGRKRKVKEAPHSTLSVEEVSEIVALMFIHEGRMDAVETDCPLEECEDVADVLGVRYPKGLTSLAIVIQSMKEFYTRNAVTSDHGFTVCANYCYVVTEKEVLQAIEPPDPWGVIWIDRISKKCKVVRLAKYIDHVHQSMVALDASKVIAQKLTAKRFGLWI